jgi:enoyl-CoA hydratase/carnithine racemase
VWSSSRSATSSPARRVIWLGFFCNLVAVIAIAVAGALPPAPFWQGQAAYETILGFTPYLLIASFCAYLVGEFLNSFVLARMKVATNGRWLWTRTIGSTLIGEGADTVIFFSLAFGATGALGRAPREAWDEDAYQHLRLTRQGFAAVVTLDRPDVHNAFNERLIGEIQRAFERLSQAEDIRAVVLCGAGKSFCAGADLNWMRASLDFTHDENIADALRLADMLRAVDTCRHPVIGRIHGAALGGGAGLIAVCDIAIAAEGTRFGFTEARLGIAPAVISQFVVPKIGQSHARALFLTAERFDAPRALAINGHVQSFFKNRVNCSFCEDQWHLFR